MAIINKSRMEMENSGARNKNRDGIRLKPLSFISKFENRSLERLTLKYEWELPPSVNLHNLQKFKT
jgi:hypothetical protein